MACFHRRYLCLPLSRTQNHHRRRLSNDVSTYAVQTLCKNLGFSAGAMADVSSKLDPPCYRMGGTRRTNCGSLIQYPLKLLSLNLHRYENGEIAAIWCYKHVEL